MKEKRNRRISLTPLSAEPMLLCQNMLFCQNIPLFPSCLTTAQVSGKQHGHLSDFKTGPGTHKVVVSHHTPVGNSLRITEKQTFKIDEVLTACFLTFNPGMRSIISAGRFIIFLVWLPVATLCNAASRVSWCINRPRCAQRSCTEHVHVSNRALCFALTVNYFGWVHVVWLGLVHANTITGSCYCARSLQWVTSNWLLEQITYICAQTPYFWVSFYCNTLLFHPHCRWVVCQCKQEPLFTTLAGTKSLCKFSFALKILKKNSGTDWSTGQCVTKWWSLSPLFGERSEKRWTER